MSPMRKERSASRGALLSVLALSPTIRSPFGVFELSSKVGDEGMKQVAYS